MMGRVFARFRDRLECIGTVIRHGLTGSRSLTERYAGPPAPKFFPPDDWRARAICDFAHWLRTAPDPPADPPHLDLEPDRFNVILELSALRQEVKRQSRGQGRVNEELAQMGSLYREALDRFSMKGEDLSALTRDAQRETERSVFLLFSDMRDALERGIEEIQKAPTPKGFFRREHFDRDTAGEGYQIALDRFDRAMGHLGIQKVLTVGREFDPRLMVAIATRSHTGQPAGTVVEETVSGYMRNEEVIRTAQVVVAA